MKKRLLAILVLGLLAVLAVPASAALAASKFSADFTLGQQSPGTISPIVIPTPGGPTVAGVRITGEVFAGTVGNCNGGSICGPLNGSSMVASQDATLRFINVSPTGVVTFRGVVKGTFTISNGPSSTSGSYRGTLKGTLTPLLDPLGNPTGAYFLNDDNRAAWRIDDSTGTGAFQDLRAGGTFLAQLGGVFPGYEVISGTLNGVAK